MEREREREREGEKQRHRSLREGGYKLSRIEEIEKDKERQGHWAKEGNCEKEGQRERREKERGEREGESCH